jgi:hypothetical protein
VVSGAWCVFFTYHASRTPHHFNEARCLKTKSSHSFQAGFGTGNYQNAQGIGCDRVSNAAYYKQEYTLGGAGCAGTRHKNSPGFSDGLPSKQLLLLPLFISPYFA